MRQATDIFTVDGILFDNEGTLIDARIAGENCWRAFASSYTLPVEDVLARVPGRPARDVIAYYADLLPVSVEEALQHYLEMSATEHTGITPIPGAAELLASLPSDRWAVVTSGTREFAMGRIQAAKLPTPSQLITADDVSTGKPDPEPYQIAAHRLGFTASGCLAIDDAPAGVTSATRAGCLTIGLLTTHNRDSLGEAFAYLPNLTHLRAVAKPGHRIEVTIL